jgi:antitoxin component of RelBE/YafQ-DinJ toxin-antitoxin module
MKAIRENGSLRIRIQDDLKKKIQKQANNLGVDMSTYIKHLVINDLKETETEKYAAKLRKSYMRVLEDIKQGKAKGFDNVDDLMKALQDDDDLLQ